jgi:hypothetical protein
VRSADVHHLYVGLRLGVSEIGGDHGGVAVLQGRDPLFFRRESRGDGEGGREGRRKRRKGREGGRDR